MPGSAAAAASCEQTLVVWDFDWSMIEENSDTFVLQQLGATELYKRGRAEGVPWTQLMDRCLLEAAQQLGRTQADVLAALRATPFHSALVALLRDAAAAPGLETLIVSDANTVYIDEILAHHGLAGGVAEVHSNPAEWRGGALRVAPYHAEPHGCRLCPANLCKGRVLDEYLERRSAAGRRYARILYVGDGKGDYCPSQLLLHGARHWHPEAPAAAGQPKPAAASGGSGSAPAPAPCGGAANRVFARSEYPDGLPCSLRVMLRTEAAAAADGGDSGAKVVAGATADAAPRVVPWSRPEELAALLRVELGLVSLEA